MLNHSGSTPLRVFPGESMVKNLPAIAGDNRSIPDLGKLLVQEDPLEKEIATYSSSLALEIPWTVDPGGLQSMELKKGQT